MMSLLPSMDQGRCGASMWCEHGRPPSQATRTTQDARAHTHTRFQHGTNSPPKGAPPNPAPVDPALVAAPKPPADAPVAPNEAEAGAAPKDGAEEEAPAVAPNHHNHQVQGLGLRAKQ